VPGAPAGIVTTVADAVAGWAGSVTSGGGGGAVTGTGTGTGELELTVDAIVADAGADPAATVTGGGGVTGAPPSRRSTSELTTAAAVPATRTPLTDRIMAIRACMVCQRTGDSDTDRRRFLQDSSKMRLTSGARQCERARPSRMSTVKLLLVEDDRSIAASLTEGLVADGHQVDHAGSGRAAIDSIGATTYDMVLLDLGLPDVDGREVCRAIRQRSNVPIIMITARGDELDRVVGLELGADDYVTKPFSLREVLARIRAVARRTNAAFAGIAGGIAAAPGDDQVQTVGSLRIDLRARRVFVDDTAVALTAKEFDVLVCLADDPGAVRTRTEILEQVWDMNWFGPTKTVDAHVAALRKKLGDARWIEAVRGVGFRLEPPSADGS
jgi:DNA-binding response OmpR family regulator